MDKELHQQEIEQSHRKGFGGSDAAMFAAITSNGLDGLSNTHLRRIAEVMGLREPAPRFVNEAMENGHKFEDWYEKNEITSAKWQREAKIGNEQVEPKNFDIFAHADFFQPGNAILMSRVLELKFSHFTSSEVLKTYRWQLQWYYMLGIDWVQLVHGQGDVEKDRVHYDVIEVDKDDNMVNVLEAGIHILDDAITNGWTPAITEVEKASECPFAVSYAMSALKDDYKSLKIIQDRIDKNKAVIAEYMANNLLSTIESEDARVSYVKPTTSKTFDSKAYFKANPVSDDVKAQFMTEKTKAGYVSYVENKPKSDVQPS